jgi:hypothetical protein
VLERLPMRNMEANQNMFWIMEVIQRALAMRQEGGCGTGPINANDVTVTVITVIKGVD